MEIRFKDVKVGEEFMCNSDKFIKIDDTDYPSRTPLNHRKSNCINRRNNHRCVMGAMVEVDIVEESSS